jgi:hypothetical protein
MNFMVELARPQPNCNPSNLPVGTSNISEEEKDKPRFVTEGLHTLKRNRAAKNYLLARKRPSSWSWVPNILRCRLFFVLSIGYALFLLD